MHHFDFTRCRILLVGDLMIDEYVSGHVGRLSPEAPVPVLLSDKQRLVAGGAGNVAANLASLGAEVRVVSAIGADETGHRLTELLSRFPTVSTDWVVRDPSRPTTRKTRVMTGLHQIVRIDTELSSRIPEETENKVAQAIVDLIGWADVVVLSDYAKGVCSDRVLRAAIEAAREAGKPSIVDPKRRDFEIYRGATLIKPNRRELADATGMRCNTDTEAESAAGEAIARTGSAILLSRSEQGISYFETGRKPLHVKTAAQDVFDVSGAGDTVISLVALGTAARLSISESMRLANVAAGIVVSKIGTAVVSVEELDHALEAESHSSSPLKGANFSLADAVLRREEWRQRGLKVGFTNGCYDLLHPGHVSLLKAAAAECDRLIVAINNDASVKRLKGPSRPVQNEGSRAFVLGALAAVDLVVVFEEDTPANAIAMLKPDILVKGADYSIDQVVGADVVQAAGGRVLLVPLVEGQSTTSIIGRMGATT